MLPNMLENALTLRKIKHDGWRAPRAVRDRRRSDIPQIIVAFANEATISYKIGGRCKFVKILEQLMTHRNSGDRDILWSVQVLARS